MAEKNIKINATVKALPGDKVMVENYNLRPTRWEEGEVSDVELGVSKDKTARARYTVHTTRKVISRRHPWGRSIRLYVGDERIKKI